MSNEAKSLALRWLSQRSLSMGEVSAKLTQKGYLPEDIQEAVQDLVRTGLLNDRRIADNVVRRSLEHHEGPSRLWQRLVARGLDRDLVSEVMTEVHASTDWLAIAEPVGQRYDRGNPKDRTRLMRRLVREGFPSSVVRQIGDHEGSDGDGVGDY